MLLRLLLPEAVFTPRSSHSNGGLVHLIQRASRVPPLELEFQFRVPCMRECRELGRGRGGGIGRDGEALEAYRSGVESSGSVVERW